MRELEAVGLVNRIKCAMCASVPRMHRHKTRPWRLAHDHRQRVHQLCTEPYPNLDVTRTVLVGAREFFTLDWLKGYWQLARHEDPQMYYSFMTPFGVQIPTCVLMGKTDAVRSANRLFTSYLPTYCSMASSPKSSRMYLLRREAQPEEMRLIPQGRVLWRSRLNRRSPAFHAIPSLSRRSANSSTQQIGSAKKTKLISIQLSPVGWDVGHLVWFDKIKEALWAMVTMAHPLADVMVCLYTDTSEGCWRAIASHVPLDALALPLEEHCAFTDISKLWPIMEKEAFAVVESCKPLNYILPRPADLRLFIDHNSCSTFSILPIPQHGKAGIVGQVARETSLTEGSLRQDPQGSRRQPQLHDAYCLWVIETVQTINGLILRAVKTLTCELRLRGTDWHLVLALVQGALNDMPSDRLSGIDPSVCLQPPSG
ncbi:hypothetical protein H257_11089 [Aphanomyces astaci]|uniref:Uncharacterized protein n=1 Tax=Aphanomyces astaci TaxID=112090 RepID=W4G529_APHAT|nr:hypothetical protein H257_11089 [Aphanomyces astaci]ETV74124.1 hypothetical protein H257_11089 [Aphanomyces astaci]|eukprot:XP_009836230.1 hypothetical protein H257_11089 [Aphanomyces astaci]